MPVTRQRIDVAFLALLVAALLARIYLASTLPYVHDEQNTTLPLAQTISFTPGQLHLPIRAVNHPALPAYFAKASSVLFGTTPLAYRAGHVFAGMLAVVAVFFATRQWYGPVAARWAAALFAFNEYDLAVSSRATAHAPYLLFVTAALYAFSRFIGTQRVAYLYATGVALALAFYCKEHSALLWPVLILVLLHKRHRAWLRGPHPFLACGLFIALIAPDLVWNFTTGPAAARVTYGRQLQRIGGLGFSPYPLMFYAHGPVRSLHVLATGEALDDNTPEYPSMNPALGALLLAGVLMTTIRPTRGDDMQWLMLLVFWGIFGFFTLIRPGNPDGLDPVSWLWVDVTMIPAAILTGVRLAELKGRPRIAAWAFSGGALLCAAAVSIGSAGARP